MGALLFFFFALESKGYEVTVLPMPVSKVLEGDEMFIMAIA